MISWQKFLDSLATKGGQLLLLCLFVLMLLILVIWVTTRQNDSQSETVILSTFSAFSGALLGFLTGQSVGAQRKTDIVPPPPKERE